MEECLEIKKRLLIYILLFIGARRYGFYLLLRFYESFNGEPKEFFEIIRCLYKNKLITYKPKVDLIYINIFEVESSLMEKIIQNHDANIFFLKKMNDSIFKQLIIDLYIDAYESHLKENML